MSEWRRTSPRMIIVRPLHDVVQAAEAVGRGDLDFSLASRDRSRCGTVAPPDGLYLVAVTY